MNTEQKILDLYNKNSSSLFQHASEYVNNCRHEAIERFVQNGIPRRGNEDYKYTKFEPAFEDNKILISSGNESSINESIKSSDPNFINTNATQVYLVNGVLAEINLQNLPDGVEVGSFKELSAKHPEIVEKHYNKYAIKPHDALIDCNTAFANDGCFIYVGDNVEMSEEIQIINIVDATQEQHSFVRNLIVLGNNAKASVVINDCAINGEVDVFQNIVTEVFVGDNSEFNTYLIQKHEHNTNCVNSMFINQLQGSKTLCVANTLRAGLLRNNFYITMDGEYCESRLYGMCLASNKEHVDNFSLIDHAKPNCFSDEMFKNVLSHSAVSAFAGKILVRPDAQKTSAFQKNDSLLLTDTAKANAKPMLEIYADDVKCSHGATVGQLDDSALFYMRSRGIGRVQALGLLMYAFVNDVVDNIELEELKELIKADVENILRSQFVES